MQSKKRLKILIIRLKPVGDTILISSVFRNLKRIYPDSIIDIVVYPSAADAIGDNPYINRTIILKRKNLPKLIFYFKMIFSHYDMTIDFINNPTSTLIALFTGAKIKIGNRNLRNFFYTHRVNYDKIVYSPIRSLSLLQPLGLNDFSDFMPEFFIKESDKKQSENILKNKKIKKLDKLVGIFSSAKYETRKYIPEYYAELALKIISNLKCKVLFLFGKGDRESYKRIKRIIKNNKNIIFIPDTITIGQMAGIINRLSYFITNDTGPKHLATALNIPTLTIFGATEEKVWNPPNKKRFATIRKKLECAPCNKLTCETLECMRKLKPEEVYNKVKVYLKKFL